MWLEVVQSCLRQFAWLAIPVAALGEAMLLQMLVTRLLDWRCGQVKL